MTLITALNFLATKFTFLELTQERKMSNQSTGCTYSELELTDTPPHYSALESAIGTNGRQIINKSSLYLSIFIQDYLMKRSIYLSKCNFSQFGRH
jgi:hypothetical protein